jgi:HK97 family phage portal protein
MVSKLVHGNTYVLKARDGRGVVVAGYILDPYRVTPLLAPDGSVFYQLAADPLAALQDAVTVPAREMIHDVMCPLFHPLVGMSPIYAAGWPAMQGLNIRNKSDKFFTNGSRPGGVLTAPGPISQENADELKEYWSTNFSGDNIGKIAVLGDGLKYEAMAMTAEQSRLVEQLHMSDEDIAKCFNMPRYKVGVGPDPTYNNIEALAKTYYSDCLQYHIEKTELKLDYGLEVVNVPGKTLGIELDRSALFEMDTASKADAATKAIAAGMSPNEVRLRYWDLGPTPGGEKVVMQRQNWPIDLLGDDAVPPTAPPAPEPEPGSEDDMPEDAMKGLDVGAFLLHVNQKVAALRQDAR